MWEFLIVGYYMNRKDLSVLCYCIRKRKYLKEKLLKAITTQRAEYNATKEKKLIIYYSRKLVKMSIFP